MHSIRMIIHLLATVLLVASEWKKKKRWEGGERIDENLKTYHAMDGPDSVVRMAMTLSILHVSVRRVCR